MEEELHLLRDVYKTAARANLAQESFWQNMSVHYGFVPEAVPPELLELSRLAAVDYSPNLGDIPDDRFGPFLLVIYFYFLFYTITWHHVQQIFYIPYSVAVPCVFA